MSLLRSTIPTPQLVSGPAAEPLTLAEGKLWLKQDVSEDDALIAANLKAAREWFETACDRAFVEATWRLYLPYFPAVIELPYPPLVSVVSVTYLDQDEVLQTLSQDVYDVVTSRTPGLLQLASGQAWPIVAYRPEAVCVTFQSGRDAQVPEMVKAGIKMLAAFWYENRGDLQSSAAGDRPVPMAVQNIAIAAGSHRF